MVRANLIRLLEFLALISVTTSLRASDRMRATSFLRALKEDNGDEANNNDDTYTVSYNDMIVNQSQQDDIASVETEDQSGGGGNIFIDQVQKVKNTAEAQAWDFYSHAPSEWTNAEWNAVFVLIAIASLSCCCLAGCFFYCCIRPDDEDDGEEKGRFRRPRIVCRRRGVRVDSPSTRKKDNTDEKSHSTTSSGRSFETFEIENDKNKPLLQKEGNLIRNMSLVKNFEQILMPKTKSRSQRTAAATVKSEPAHYSRMKM